MSRPLVLLLVLALAALAGCGGGGEDDQEQVEQTVRDFVTATNERDADKFCGELVTREFLERTTGATGDQAEEECTRQIGAIQGLELKLVSIDETKIDGDSATVEVTIAAQGAERPQTLTLEKEDGDWKLSAGAAGS